MNLDTVTSLNDLKLALNSFSGNAAVVLTLDDTQYLAVKGQGKVALLKDGSETLVIVGNGAVVGASGKTNPNNRFLLQSGSVSKEYQLPQKTAKFDFLKFIPKKDLYLRGLDKERFRTLNVNRKAVLTIGVVLFLIYAIFRQVAYRLENDKGIKTDREIVKVEEKIREAMELAQLNKVLARENLENQKRDLLNFDGDKKKIAAEVAKIDEKIKEILQINTITPEVFYDFNLAKEGVNSGAGFYLDGKLNFLDTNSGTVIPLDAKTKSGKVLAADEKFKGSSFISQAGDRIYVFGNDGIYRINMSTNKKDQVIKKSDKWQEIKTLVAFAGNIYLLDGKSNQIWKHIATDTGFTDARNYLTTDTVVDFSGAAAMDINGSIYIADADKILKFTQGRKVDFNLVGLDKPVGQITLIAAMDELENIYLWDKPNQRIIVITESGQYLSQYLIGGNINPTGLFADEPLKKIFLLSGSKVYGVDIK